MHLNPFNNANQLNFTSVDRVIVWSDKTGKWQPSTDFEENKRTMRLIIRRANSNGSDEVNALDERSDVMKCLRNNNSDYRKDFEKYQHIGSLSLSKPKMEADNRGTSIVNMIYDKDGGFKLYGNDFLPISYIVTGKEQIELRKIGNKITTKRKLKKNWRM